MREPLSHLHLFILGRQTQQTETAWSWTVLSSMAEAKPGALKHVLAKEPVPDKLHELQVRPAGGYGS
jgi:hypothetical protein